MFYIFIAGDKSFSPCKSVRGIVEGVKLLNRLRPVVVIFWWSWARFLDKWLNVDLGGLKFFNLLCRYFGTGVRKIVVFSTMTQLYKIKAQLLILWIFVFQRMRWRNVWFFSYYVYPSWLIPFLTILYMMIFQVCWDGIMISTRIVPFSSKLILIIFVCQDAFLYVN